jgi:hypothetical protein
MFHLTLTVRMECRQAAVSGAIGMTRQDDAARRMQANRKLHLFQDESAIKSGAWRGECQTAAGMTTRRGCATLLRCKNSSLAKGIRVSKQEMTTASAV